MAHDVFISHARQDKSIADAVCANLEQAGIRCWIAPRDIEPGADWGASLMDGLKTSKILVLVLSSSANASPHIRREVERAVHQGITVVPLRVEDVVPEGALEYHLGTVHWLDAMTPPLEAHLHRLVDILSAILARVADKPAPPAKNEPVPPPRKPDPEPAPPPITQPVVRAKTSDPAVVAPPVVTTRVVEPPPPRPAPPPMPPPSPRKDDHGSLSEFARLINVFVAPRKTFADLCRNSNWWVPFVVITVTSYIRFFVFKSAYPEALDSYGWFTWLGVRLRGGTAYGFPLADLLYYFLLAAVWFGIFRKFGGDQLTLRRVFAIVIYAQLPGILADAIGSLQMLGILHPLPVFGSYFIEYFQGNFNLPHSSFWLALLSEIDVFMIWSLVLCALGLSEIGKLKRLVAMLGVFGSYCVIAVLRGAIVSLFGGIVL